MTLRAAVLETVLLAALSGAAIADGSYYTGSGTLSGANPVIVRQTAPLQTSVTPRLATPVLSVGIGGSEALCNGCDRYLLTVEVPDAYRQRNPHSRLHIEVSWPSASEQFDLALIDARTNVQAGEDRRIGTNPHVLDLPNTPGTRQFEVQVIPFRASGGTPTVSMSLLPGQDSADVWPPARCSLPGSDVNPDRTPYNDSLTYPVSDKVDTHVDGAYIAEPYDAGGSKRIVFTLSAPAFGSAAEAAGTYFIHYTLDDGVSRFVSYTVNDAVARAGPLAGFQFGRENLDEGQYLIDGITDAGSKADPALHRITWVLDRNRVPGLAEAKTLHQVYGVYRPVTGALGISLVRVEQRDSTEPAEVALKGNHYCAPDPVAQLRLRTGATGAPGALSSFDAAGSSAASAPQYPITGYRFDFGDGSAPLVQSQPYADHRYLRQGSFAARVWVRDARGRESPASAPVAVTIK